MIDPVDVRGDESGLEDDFEWVNAWAAMPRIGAQTAPVETANGSAVVPAARANGSVVVPAETANGPVIVLHPSGAAAPTCEAVIHADTTMPEPAERTPQAVTSPWAASPEPTAIEPVMSTVAGQAVAERASTELSPEPMVERLHDLDVADAGSLPVASPGLADAVAAAGTANGEEAAAAPAAPESAELEPFAVAPFEAARPTRRMGRLRWTNLFRLITRESTRDANAKGDPLSGPLDLEPVIATEPLEPVSATDPLEPASETEPPEEKSPPAGAQASQGAPAPDQLERDIVEIELVRDRLMVEAMPTQRRTKRRARLLPVRTSDYVPILVGSALAFASLVVFGAAASFMSLR